MELMRTNEARSTFLRQLLALCERVDVLAQGEQIWPFAIGDNCMVIGVECAQRSPADSAQNGIARTRNHHG